MYKFYQILTWPFLHIIYPAKFIGKKNLPKGKAVLVCNHFSNHDPVILATHIWKKQHFVAKKELFKKFIPRAFLKSIGTISIDRQGTDLKAIRACLKHLNKGRYVTIFPEGTRNKVDENLQEIKSGAVLIALKAKAPIVPMWIEKRPKPFRKTVVRIGEPISLEKYEGVKLSQELIEEVGSKMVDSMLKLKNDTK